MPKGIYKNRQLNPTAEKLRDRLIAQYLKQGVSPYQISQIFDLSLYRAQQIIKNLKINQQVEK